MSLLFLNIKNAYYNITENFNTSEIIKASHSNDDIVLIDKKVVEVAQYIRTALKTPVGINSAFRSPEYNATLEGSAKNSQHIHGKALDLRGNGIVEFMEEAYRTKNEHWVKMYDLGLRGLGFYSWGVHIDTRDSISVANWDYRKKKVLIKSIWSLILAIILIWIIKKQS
ncbi:YcbK family protein [Wocania ichthyoenteri]|uniref:YcbK family protein n=1 Tax=Wocania ichthyoenteri TaxID=1230531 RepID=UPI00068F08B4|nr:D-Ala-D-Ala carboxypeptidase family metallohydrolase [Wocania ichthyoenteri]